MKKSSLHLQFEAVPCNRNETPRSQTRPPRGVTRSFCFVFLLVILGLLASPRAQAQFDTASVLGSIKDPSGADVPGATVTLLSASQGISVTRTSDSGGNYEFSSVQPGNYTLSVTASGFQNTKTDRFTVTVGARQRVDVALTLGATSQTVTVSGAANLLETDTSDRGEIIGQHEAVNLPLNGRSYADLATLVPGVRKSMLEVLSNPSRDASYNVNGMNSMVNNFQLDGIDNNAYQTANQGYSNEAVVPSPDAVQEFKVETDNYSAEYGRAAGAIINATIRSGTNQFHGVVYDYLRNTVLNAYGPFLGTGVKPTLVQNQFGATFGGPIRKDKLFFFTDYEGLRHIDHSLIGAVLPTAAQRSGTFTDSNGAAIPLRNPVTGKIYTNGVIPASDISPFAQAVMNALPQANTQVAAGGNNYTSQPGNTVTDDKGDIRIDSYLSEKATAFGRYSQRAVYFYLAPNIPGLAGGNSNGTLYARTRQIAGGYNYNLSANSILETRLGLTWTQSGKSPINLGATNLLAEFNIPNAPTDPSFAGGLNTQSVTGFSQFGRQATNPQFTSPFLANPKVNYAWLKGRHSLKFGYEYGWLTIAISDFHPKFGSDTYAGQFSRVTAATAADVLHRQAYNLADFLFGARSHYELNNVAEIDYYRRWHMGYVQDDYKVMDHLTLNLGLRYELVTPNWARGNHLANFDPTTNTLVQASGGSLYNRTLINLNTNNFAPRLGFALTLRPGTVVRGGYAISYLHYFRFGGESTLGYNGPYIVDATIDQNPPFPGGGSTQPLCSGSTTQDPTTCFRTTQQGYVDKFATAANFSTLKAQTRYVPRHFPTGYVETFHFDIQQQLMKNTLLDLAYVGNHGTHIPVLGDYNQATTEPVSCNSGVGCLTTQARRPIANFTNILEAFAGGFLDYNSLQAKLERRYSNGIFLINSFTWSKAINNASADLETSGGDSAVVNVRNVAGDRGLSSYDQTFNNTLSIIADLPFGPGHQFGAHAPGWQQAVLGGWQLTAIHLATSGLPINPQYTPSSSVAVSSASATYSVRPNLVSTASAIYAPRSSWVKTNAALNGTLNASALSTPTPSQYFGTAGRNILRGSSFGQLDLGAHKTFSLGSEGRNLEFRMEAFNVLNATNFQTPDSNISDGASFGAYTASNVFPARQVQMALRLSF